MSTASYLLNRMVSRSLGEITLFELWYGYKPNLEHLRIFGSPCYVLQPEIKRRKLDQKDEVGILIGYNTKSNGYKVFDLKTNKTVIGRNVKVIEGQIWNWGAEIVEETRNEFLAENEEPTEVDEEDIP